MDGTFDEMVQALTRAGLLAALKVLNDHVPQRYTAVYRLADDHLVNLALVDKRNEPCPPFLLAVPYHVSFCQFTLGQGQFRTDNSALDDRLDGHPYQGVMNSYHAVPLITTDGAITGTLCHFDTQALPLPDEDFELLRLAARMIPTFLPH
jgi:GAF domain-containing protein